MNNLLSHILIFQQQEELNKILNFIFAPNTDYPQRRYSYLYEFLQALTYQQATKLIEDFGYPVEVSDTEFQLAQWLALNVLPDHFKGSPDHRKLLYTSRHSWVSQANSSLKQNPQNTSANNSICWSDIWNVNLDVDYRKQLLVSGLIRADLKIGQAGGL